MVKNPHVCPECGHERSLERGAKAAFEHAFGNCLSPKEDWNAPFFGTPLGVDTSYVSLYGKEVEQGERLGQYSLKYLQRILAFFEALHPTKEPRHIRLEVYRYPEDDGPILFMDTATPAYGVAVAPQDMDTQGW